MQFGSLKYEHSVNCGDEIQSLAAEQYLPTIDHEFDRENLRTAVANEKHIVIMNGWFADYPETAFPPSNSIDPLFFGFHLTDWTPDTASHFLTDECLEYFKSHEPIGCRDQGTADLLASKGVDVFYSKCLTLTFPKREVEPKNGKIFLVDAEDIPLPLELRNKVSRLSHECLFRIGTDARKQMARNLLQIYREEASLVITTRLHSCMPCIAMGIPVVYVGKLNDVRTDLLKDINVKINRMPTTFERILYLISKNPSKKFLKKRIQSIAAFFLNQLYLKHIDWNPEALDIVEEQERMRKKIREMVEKKTLAVTEAS